MAEDEATDEKKLNFMVLVHCEGGHGFGLTYRSPERREAIRTFIRRAIASNDPDEKVIFVSDDVNFGCDLVASAIVAMTFATVEPPNPEKMN